MTFHGLTLGTGDILIWPLIIETQITKMRKKLLIQQRSDLYYLTSVCCEMSFSEESSHLSRFKVLHVLVSSVLLVFLHFDGFLGSLPLMINRH